MALELLPELELALELPLALELELPLAWAQANDVEATRIERANAIDLIVGLIIAGPP